MIRHVAIIGGGFSGALQAINLLRHDGPRATLIEQRTRIGRGVAYSAAHPDHLLNVRAANMSALPDNPRHFVDWLERTHPEHASGFAPRLVYGDYLGALLDETRRDAEDRLAIVSGEACDVLIERDNVTVHLTDGRLIHADAVVLAPGNLPPHPPNGIDPEALLEDCYAADPWAGDLADGLGPEDMVLLLGTGLTMVDAALLLEARGFAGRILALSRRGLFPRPHAGQIASSTLTERPPSEAVALLRSVRRRAAESGWRAAVDELRPYTQCLWLTASEDQRRRFLRHLRPWWDVHRHRLAPEVAERIAGMRERGQLEVVAGSLTAVASRGASLSVAYRPRGTEESRILKIRRIVNCTGPQGDLLRTRSLLLRNLHERGYIRPDPLNLGIDVNQQSEVVNVRGETQRRLLALGPITRGTFWEIVAIPDIRHQTWSVARRLSNAHWVGSEGL